MLNTRIATNGGQHDEGRRTMIRSDSNYMKEENNLQEFSLDLSYVQSYN
jgi:hypothetical protein